MDRDLRPDRTIGLIPTANTQSQFFQRIRAIRQLTRHPEHVEPGKNGSPVYSRSVWGDALHPPFAIEQRVYRVRANGVLQD